MKLLAVKVGLHDCNFCYYDGSKYHYHKSERKEQIKHHTYADLAECEEAIKNLWGITYNDVDEIATVFTPKRYNMKEVPQNFFPSIDCEDFPSKTKTIIVNHHYAHALSTYLLCDREPDVSIVIDGVGQGKTWSVYRDGKLIADGSEKELGSIGNHMSQAAFDLGITGDINDVSGKLMGLQSYGKVNPEYLQYLNQFDIHKVNEIFSKDQWNPWDIVRHPPINWIKTVHHRIGYVILDLFSKYIKETDLVTYSGGVAQNVIWNTQLKIKYPNLIIPPHCSDDGLTIGAMEFLRIKHNLPKLTLDNFPYSQTDEGVEEPSEETINITAKLLSEGKIVGWYQGNGELGPRALGNRSILMDPRLPGGREKMNNIKRREQYRPFGASVLKEYTTEYFNTPTETFDNPFMLYVAVTKGIDLSSITHVDATCRVQTVDDRNPVFRKLMEEFYKMTGCAVVLNTSLNLGGKPIAGYKDDALELFKTTDMDVMVIGNTIYKK